MEDFDKYGVNPEVIQEVAQKLEHRVFECNEHGLFSVLGCPELGGESALAHEPERRADTPPERVAPPSTNRRGELYRQAGNLLYIGLVKQGDHNFYCGLDGQTSCLIYGSALADSFYALANKLVEDSRASGVPQEAKYKGAAFFVAPPHGGQKVSFSYRLIFPGLEVLIHRSPSEKIPLAKVVFGWQSLDKGNPLSIMSEIMGWLEDCGSVLQGYHISRLDLQCTGDFPLDEIFKAAQDDRFVSYQRKKTFVSEGPFVQTLTLGGYTSPVMLRVYDKLQEIADSSDATKEAQILGRFRRAWSENWDGVSDFDLRISRVEFSCKREFLRLWGISTFDDLSEKITSLVYYLSHNWLRFVVPTADSNSRRAPMLPIWDEISRMFCSYFWGGFQEMQRVPEKEGSAFLSDEQRRRTRATVVTMLSKLIADSSLRGNKNPKLAVIDVISDVRADAVLDAVSIIRDVFRKNSDLMQALGG